MAERAARISFAILATAGLGVVVATCARVVSAGVPSPERLVGACAKAFVPRASLAWLAAIVLSALVAVSLARAAAAIVSLVRARARVRRLRGRSATLSGREVVLVPTRRAVAFCAGLRRPRIHLSAGAVDLLDDRQLAAVLAHERHHVRRRDPLRLAVREVVTRALFFVPGLDAIGGWLDELSERAADEHAVRSSGGDPRPLAGALLVFDSVAAPAGAGISPSRVDHLTGRPVSWALPSHRLVVAAVVLAGLVTLFAASASLGAAAAAALHVCLASIVLVGGITSPLVFAASGRRGRT